MISQAFRHCPGIGPARLARLQAAGVSCWADVVAEPERIPVPLREALLAECRRCLAAQADGDVRYFVDRFAPQDKWRILAHYFPQTSFFDIETEGLEYDAPISVIACWHRGSLHTFSENQNLDDFLELLDEVVLLASFNGNAFDVPRVLGRFHIPALPCPHVDLRWMCHHRGWKGGLKEIAHQLEITRPVDLRFADGELAVRLWQQWRARGDAAALSQLLRYCAADVVLLVILAHRLAGIPASGLEQLWCQLPAVAGESPSAAPPEIFAARPRLTWNFTCLRGLRARQAR